LPGFADASFAEAKSGFFSSLTLQTGAGAKKN
jgi:hypothetical protein